MTKKYVIITQFVSWEVIGFGVVIVNFFSRFHLLTLCFYCWTNKQWMVYFLYLVKKIIVLKILIQTNILEILNGSLEFLFKWQCGLRTYNFATKSNHIPVLFLYFSKYFFFWTDLMTTCCLELFQRNILKGFAIFTGKHQWFMNK